MFVRIVTGMVFFDLEKPEQLAGHRTVLLKTNKTENVPGKPGRT
jgi:hypothetical protein